MRQNILKAKADWMRQSICTNRLFSFCLIISSQKGDVSSEKDILMKAVGNCRDNDKFKKRLKEING